MIVAIQNRNPKSNNFAAGAGPGRQSDQMKMGNRQGATGNSGKVKFFLCALVGLLFAFSISAQAQQPEKIFRIGFLDRTTASGSALLIDAFRQELSKLGWIERKNITIEYRFAEGKAERLPESGRS